VGGPGGHRAWHLLVVQAAILGFVLLAMEAASSRHVSLVASSQGPSIVLVVTDDQRWDMLGRMPEVKRLLIDHGVVFENGFVVNALCCPSRATILTGQYSHSTGMYLDGPPHGGFASFRDSSTVATWLHDVGYHTALFGKYLNGYSGTYIPPGWDRWLAFQQNGRADYYYNYSVNDQGRVRSFGDASEDYSTNVLASDAVSFIKRTSGPLLLYVAPYAPHGPATPAPRDVLKFPRMKSARPPSYDEADVSDKPTWVRALPLMSSQDEADADALRIKRYRSLLAVDRMVGRIVRALASTGRLHHSLIVFTSDQGILLGEHRWLNRKEAAYEESIRVPFVVRYDPLVHDARVDDHLVLNLDLAQTFAEAADVEAPGARGQSLLPLLAWPSTSWRSDFLIEHLDDGTPGDPSTFCAVRTTRYLYVEYQDGEEELYDLKTDPYELRNAVRDPRIAQILEALRLRVRDLCDPPPPGYTFSH